MLHRYVVDQAHVVQYRRCQQPRLKLGAFGLLTFGMKSEQEQLVSTERHVLPFDIPERETVDAMQITHSVYAIHQFSPLENLHLSLGGRLDKVENGETFATWRATAAR